MDEDFLWAILGLTLVIVELLTGTFYLLVLGVAAFGAALVAWLGQGFAVQAIVAALIAALGCYGVHVYRTKSTTRQMAPVDAGQPAKRVWTNPGATPEEVAKVALFLAADATAMTGETILVDGGRTRLGPRRA